MRLVVIVMPTEFLMSVNTFNEPTVLEGDKAVGTLLTRLLLLEPGTIQTHPAMGVGLVSKYRYCMEGEEYNLQVDFQKQIENYLPQFQGVKVTVQQKDMSFIIAVQIDSKLFSIDYNTNTNGVQTKYTTLSNI